MSISSGRDSKRREQFINPAVIGEEVMLCEPVYLLFLKLSLHLHSFKFIEFMFRISSLSFMMTVSCLYSRFLTGWLQTFPVITNKIYRENLDLMKRVSQRLSYFAHHDAFIGRKTKFSHLVIMQVSIVKLIYNDLLFSN